MQLGGARGYQTPITLDGFNVTDPATGLSSLNLPLEAVKGIDALRDPMAVTYGGLVGGLIKIDSRSGGATFAKGVQGFVPRPRFSTPGFGRLEGIFPRAFASGSVASGRIRYVAAGEDHYERIPVPEVTDRTGHDLVDESAIMFTRVDARLSSRSTVTVEAFSFPARTRSFGLGPRRDVSATVDLHSHDAFAGLIHRLVTRRAGVFTVRLGAYSRAANVAPNGGGSLMLSPAGSSGNWFSTVSRVARRFTAAATWDGVVRLAGRTHEVTATVDGASLKLSGRVDEQPIVVTNSEGAVVRSVTFGPASSFGSRDILAGIALQTCGMSASGSKSKVAPESTIAATAAAPHRPRPARTDGCLGQDSDQGGLRLVCWCAPAGHFSVWRLSGTSRSWFDAQSGDLTLNVTFRPMIGSLRLPRALATVVGIERELAPGLDAQAIVTNGPRREWPCWTFHCRMAHSESTVPARARIASCNSGCERHGPTIATVRQLRAVVLQRRTQRVRRIVPGHGPATCAARRPREDPQRRQASLPDVGHVQPAAPCGRVPVPNGGPGFLTRRSRRVTSMKARRKRKHFRASWRPTWWSTRPSPCEGAPPTSAYRYSMSPTIGIRATSIQWRTRPGPVSSRTASVQSFAVTCCSNGNENRVLVLPCLCVDRHCARRARAAAAAAAAAGGPPRAIFLG